MTPMPGRYPGGPTRAGSESREAEEPRKVRLATVQEFETRVTSSSMKMKKKARHRRLVVGFFFSLIVAVVVGSYIGISSHRTEEEVAREMEGEAPPSKADMEKQMDRLIDEMWKSEALEKGPGIR